MGIKAKRTPLQGNVVFQKELVFLRRYTRYLGRNGEGTCVGVSISKVADVIALRPITTQSKTTMACEIQMRIEDIDEFVELMLCVRDERMPDRP